MMRRQYKPDQSGLVDLGRDSALSAVCRDAAEAGRQFAAADDPGGTYTVQTAMVPGGYTNTMRAGAILEETTGHGEGGERRTLVRTVPIIENSR